MARKKRPAKSGVRVRKGDVSPPNAIRQKARIATGPKSHTIRAFVEWYQGRISKPDFLLDASHFHWSGTHNPYYVWTAIDICIREKIELPDWVNQYLAECAKRMLSTDTTKSGRSSEGAN
jgi:hypothetical protein